MLLLSKETLLFKAWVDPMIREGHMAQYIRRLVGKYIWVKSSGGCKLNSQQQIGITRNTYYNLTLVPGHS